MELNKDAIFVIKTIAHYTFFDKCEKEGIISKEIFDNSYNKFTDIQKSIISSSFINEETMLFENCAARISDSNIKK